jgi:ATP-binding cassette subfamily F protein 3
LSFYNEADKMAAGCRISFLQKKAGVQQGIMKGIQLQDISIAFGARQCLDGVSLNFLFGQKIALTGANGSGKSTLMKIISGLLGPDSGVMIKSREARVTYLPQSNVVYGDEEVAREVQKAFHEQDRMAVELARLEEEISQLNEDSVKLAPLLVVHDALRERLLWSGYFLREKKSAEVLRGLGFTVPDFTKKCGSFSQGWQMRIALAKVLLEDPDFLLLDEPTNYLDLEARAWLLDYLHDFPGGILMVSHDRFFLDNTIGAVAELFAGKMRIFKGNYSGYEEARAKELESLIARYEALEEEREKAETFIRRFRAQASRASLVQSRIKQLEKLPRLEIPPSVKHIHFTFPPPPHCVQRVLLAEGLGKKYGQTDVFSGINLEVVRGEKIVFVGPNGAGKSTLLRLLAVEEEPSAGSVLYGEGTEIGYYSVDLSFHSSDSRTVLETLEAVSPTELFGKLRTLLGAFLFPGDDAFKSVGILSGGEQSRILLLTLLLKPKNLLILDEPTNHLDMASKDVLLDALKRFQGTVLFVSHDRDFIEGLAQKVIELGDGKATVYNGDYQYYLWKKGAAAALATNDLKMPQERAGKDGEKNEYHTSKRVKSNLRKIEREEAELLQRIDEISAEKKQNELSLADPEIYRNGERMKEVKTRIDAFVEEERRAFLRWQELEEERKKASCIL